MEGKSVKTENMSTAWYESMSRQYRKMVIALKYHCPSQAILLKNRKAYILFNIRTIYGCHVPCIEGNHMQGRRRLPKKVADKFRGGRGGEVKKKGQKWNMEDKSVKPEKMSTAWCESMSELMKK